MKSIDPGLVTSTTHLPSQTNEREQGRRQASLLLVLWLVTLLVSSLLNILAQEFQTTPGG